MGRKAATSVDEVFSSSEVDTNPLSAISCKVKVVSLQEYNRLRKLRDQVAYPEPRKCFPPAAQDKKAVQQALELQLEKGSRVRLKRLDMLRKFQESRVLFARHHYNHKSAVLEGVNHPSRKEGTGKCPWLHSFLFATQQRPDVSHLLSAQDIATNQCPYSRGVVDVNLRQIEDAIPSKGLPAKKKQTSADPTAPASKTAASSASKAGQKPAVKDASSVLKATTGAEATPAQAPEKAFEAAQASAPCCSYCFQSLFLLPAFHCAVCPGVVMCIDCFSAGRQGAVHASEGCSVRFIHKASHPYRVARPQLSPDNPGLGIRALDYIVGLYGGLTVKYELVSIVRGPLASKEHRAPGPRFCYGLCLDPCEDNDTRERGRKLGNSSRTLGKAFGKTVEEACGLVALAALQNVFGIGNSLSAKVIGMEWTAFEALRLLDSLEVYGLAWDPAAAIVGSKSVLQGRDFYNQRLLPAWAASEDWAKEYRASCKDPKVLAKINKMYTGKSALPAASPEAVATAVEEAMAWAKQVDGMVTRRSRLARKKKRGLSIALVDKMIVYAPRPSSFGPYATSETSSLAQPMEDLAALRDGSVCVVCKKTDSPELIVLCDGCDEEFHIGCLSPPLKAVPEGDWFCNNCMEDRAYLYDHCSWGDAGKVLCNLAAKHGKSVSKLNLPLSVKQWEDNDKVLRSATMKALAMGYANGNVPVKPKAAPQPQQQQQAKRKRQAEEGIPAEATRKRKRPADAKPKKGAVQFNPNDPDVQNAVAWATRHFADAAVSALQATTRGLAQALQAMTAQRDALAAELERLKSGKAKEESK